MLQKHNILWLFLYKKNPEYGRNWSSSRVRIIEPKLKNSPKRHVSSHGYLASSISQTLTKEYGCDVQQVCGGYIQQVCCGYIKQVWSGYIRQVCGSYIRRKKTKKSTFFPLGEFQLLLSPKLKFLRPMLFHYFSLRNFSGISLFDFWNFKIWVVRPSIIQFWCPLIFRIYNNKKCN